MKINKKILSFVLAVLMIASTLALSSCGGAKNSGTIQYSVKVLDGFGEPCTTGVIVKFIKDGQQVAMQPVDGNGVSSKELDSGDYTFELVFTDSSVSSYYDTSLATLSAENNTVEISLMNGISGEGSSLYATSPVDGEHKEYTAYNVNVGSTYVTLKANDRNYFLFVPAEAGTYEISVDNKDMAVGYYGAPHFVQQMSITEIVDNAFTISVSSSNIGSEGGGTSTYVFGIDGVSEESNCVLSIKRIGDPEHSISDEPFTEYKTTHVLKPFTLKLAEGEKLTYVNIKGDTDDYVVVLNEEDGFYHLGDKNGPLLYVNLGDTAPYVSLKKVINGDGLAGGAPIRKYFFDENGDFVKREDYTNILSDYFENMDPDLYIYPLTEDLVYIIKNGCEGWWNPSSPDYIFEGCNSDIGWMFACCYVK